MISIKIEIRDRDKELVNLSLDIDKSLALVGQSGSGKSLTLKALLGMVPNSLNSKIDISADFEFVRGESISFVPQNPFTALSPRTLISKQWFRDKDIAMELFDAISLDRELFYRYPPQLSGGELQRVILAIALATKPKLILLDEPTTALDPKIREDLIPLLIQLQNRYNFAMLFVSHDIELASKLCQDMIVIKSGREIERGKSQEILNSPKEHYTKELIDSNFRRREFRE